ncbi:hypothetical protein B484DRAFT_450345 [Ochromonadaceae sp. CCMP2298]|nr:hypothetical protein B484DRAFT_450345 [Ochromonadaceae sp. CCMP2298]
MHQPTMHTIIHLYIHIIIFLYTYTHIYILDMFIYIYIYILYTCIATRIPFNTALLVLSVSELCVVRNPTLTPVRFAFLLCPSNEWGHDLCAN